jgi:hypothetical protein
MGLLCNNTHPLIMTRVDPVWFRLGPSTHLIGCLELKVALWPKISLGLAPLSEEGSCNGPPCIAADAN